MLDQRIVERTKNLDWCLQQCINGDLSGDSPSDLDKLLIALQELRELQKRRDILVVFCKKAWSVTNTDCTLRDLVSAAERRDYEQLFAIVQLRNGRQLVSHVHFDPTYYSEVVIA